MNATSTRLEEADDDYVSSSSTMQNVTQPQQSTATPAVVQPVDGVIEEADRTGGFDKTPELLH